MLKKVKSRLSEKFLIANFKFLILFLLFIIHYSLLIAQDTWIKTYSPFYIDDGWYEVEDVIVCQDGGYAVNGTFVDYDAEMGIEWAHWGFLMKTDSNGNLLWAKADTVDFMGWNESYTFVETGNGDFIIIGYSYGGGYMIKRDSEGNRIWAIPYNDFGANSMCKTSDGNIILGGVVASEIALRKIDSDGNTIWTNSHNCGYTTIAKSIIQTSDGGYALTGYTSGNGYDIIVMKTDTIGDSLWTRTYDGYGLYDEGNCIVETDNDYILVAGVFEHPFPINNYGFLGKFDLFGYVDFIYEFENWNIRSCLEDIDNNYVIYSGHAMLKTNDYGDTLWSNGIPYWGNYGDRCFQKTGSNFLCLSKTSGHIKLSKTDSVGQVTAINDNLIQTNEINFICYPNPFNPETTISFSLLKNTEISLKIYNIKGQLVETLLNEQKAVGNNSIVWNAKEYSSGLRNATDPVTYTDEVMRFYWCKLIGIDPPPEGENGEGDFRGERADYEPINKASTYAKEAFWGAIGHDMPITNPPTADTTKLNLAKKYLIDSLFIDYLDLDSVWVEYSDGITGDCLSLGSLLANVGFIVDMLWHYVGDSEQDSLRNKLDNIAYYVNHMLNQGLPIYNHCVGQNCSGGWIINTDPNLPEYYPDYLQTYWTNGRIRLAGALGYAGCVLDSLEYIDTAENDLFELPLDTGHNGFIELMTSNGGFYSEGISYTSYTFNGLDLFLTARKRVYEVDWFSNSNSNIPQLYVNSLYLTAPDFGPIAFDDVTISHINTNGTLYRPRPFSQMVTYFYHSDESDFESRNLIRWLMNEYNEKYDTYFGLWDFRKLYAYNQERVLGDPPSHIPDYLSQGTYHSNDEFTIFHKSISDADDFYYSPTLIVNHENSVDYGTHEDSDQSSFILYYKGRPILIDPGYKTSKGNAHIGREWLSSPFAHNLIMVNPTCVDPGYSEEDELDLDYSRVVLEGIMILGIRVMTTTNLIIGILNL